MSPTKFAVAVATALAAFALPAGDLSCATTPTCMSARAAGSEVDGGAL